MDKDYDDYKDFDMTGATRGIPTPIARLQKQAQIQPEPSLIDPDVWQLIKAKADDKQKIADMNGFLRVFFA